MERAADSSSDARWRRCVSVVLPVRAGNAAVLAFALTAAALTAVASPAVASPAVASPAVASPPSPTPARRQAGRRQASRGRAGRRHSARLEQELGATDGQGRGGGQVRRGEKGKSRKSGESSGGRPGRARATAGGAGGEAFDRYELRGTTVLVARRLLGGPELRPAGRGWLQSGVQLGPARHGRLERGKAQCPQGHPGREAGQGHRRRLQEGVGRTRPGRVHGRSRHRHQLPGEQRAPIGAERVGRRSRGANLDGPHAFKGGVGAEHRESGPIACHRRCGMG